jgi:transcriptional regulator with XRE-family HTH domain
MTDIRNELLGDLGEEEFRHEYADEFLDMILARQIRALRKERGWTQVDLAKKLGTSQPFISAIESEDYGALSLSTLKELARVFDVYLNVRFESFARMVAQVESSSSAELQLAPYDLDPAIPAMAAESMLVKLRSHRSAVSYGGSCLRQQGKTAFTSFPWLRSAQETKFTAPLSGIGDLQFLSGRTNLEFDDYTQFTTVSGEAEEEKVPEMQFGAVA